MNRTACLISRKKDYHYSSIWGRREGELHSKELVVAVGKEGWRRNDSVFQKGRRQEEPGRYLK
jgi:hypothetical protein